MRRLSDSEFMGKFMSLSGSGGGDGAGAGAGKNEVVTMMNELRILCCYNKEAWFRMILDIA